MWDAFLDIDLIHGPVPYVLGALSVAALLYLLIRKPTWKWIFTLLIAIAGGLVLALLTIWLVVFVLDMFGGPLEHLAYPWIAGAFVAIAIAIVNLWNSRWWRKVIASVSIVLFAMMGAIGVNAVYGLTPTIGDILGISTAKPVNPVNPDNNDTDPSAVLAKPLYETWKAPADMPAKGSQGLVPGGVPNTKSGFPARPAELYLPPAALVKDAPRLPLVILMMGQPGNPDPQYIGGVLDDYAAQNNGLAPIVLVVDQLGNPANDPLCLDTSMGKVETYIMQDVVPWAQSNLNVLTNRIYTTVAGYSNGGQCAIYFGSKYPQVFGNILDISGDLYPGVENNNEVLKTVFGGNQTAYDAVKPSTIMSKTKYTDTTAIFTAGGNDPTYAGWAKQNYESATAAGMATTFYIVPGAGHVLDALIPGFQKGFEVLYPRLGLSATAPTPNPGDV